MFIAKVSKGRTIRQFMNGTLTAPVIYSFMWMTLYGGIGIRHERQCLFHFCVLILIRVDFLFNMPF